MGHVEQVRVGLAKSEQVARALERDIRAGRMTHGAALGSEQALMRRFSVSRNTVRRGLEALSRQGLITTRTGIGSFVTYDGSTIDGALGWSVALSRGAGPVETRVLDIRRGGCARADRVLGMAQEYLCIDRVRFCLEGNFGISLERSRLPWREGYQAVIDDGLVAGSINTTLAGLGLVAAGGHEVATVVPVVSAVDAAIMGRPPGLPMLRLERTTRGADGACLEYVESLLDPARFGLRIEF